MENNYPFYAICAGYGLGVFRILSGKVIQIADRINLHEGEMGDAFYCLVLKKEDLRLNFLNSSLKVSISWDWRQERVE